MSLKVINYSEIDISKIQYSDPKKTRAGSYLVEMFINNGNKRENIYISQLILRNKANERRLNNPHAGNWLCVHTITNRRNRTGCPCTDAIVYVDPRLGSLRYTFR